MRRRKNIIAMILSLSILFSSVPVLASATTKKARPRTTYSTRYVAKKTSARPSPKSRLVAKKSSAKSASKTRLAAKKAPAKSTIAVTGKPSTVKRGKNATITIRGKAHTAYTLSVQYASGKSKATKICTKTSNGSGVVSWTWKVGTKTAPGQHPITITGGSQTITTSFITTK